MRFLKGLILASGLVVGLAGESEAQFAISVGNPYAGQGVYVGTPAYAYQSYGYGGLGYPGYYRGVNNYYNSGYVAGPGTFGYSSGYAGYAAPAVGYGSYGYGYSPRPYYGSYGYGGYGYAPRGGYAPYRGVGRFFR